MENSNTQYKTLEELKSAAKAKFSEEEIENFISMGRRLACYPVLTELINVIEAAPNFTSDNRGKKLIEEVTNTMEYKQCGHISLPFKDDKGEPILRDGFDEIGIGMSLSVTKTNDSPMFDAHPDFVHAILEQMQNLRSTAITFWDDYARKHTKLLRKISKYRSDVDFGNLNVDKENKLMMYFDKNSSTRVCVFTYYFNLSTKKIYFRKPTPSEN
jgi:hypothetical protein